MGCPTAACSLTLAQFPWKNRALGFPRVLPLAMRPLCVLLPQALPGEVTEHGGRMCVAVPATADGPPKGILLGTGPRASVW